MSHPLLASALLACSLAAAVLAPAECSAQSPADTLPPDAYVQDFDALWQEVRDGYAYLDGSRTDWDRVRALYRPRAAQARGRREFLGVLEEVVRELYDPHAHVGANTAASPRMVPSGTDVWAEWRQSRAVITDVRAGSRAERAGVRAGQEVTSIGGRPVDEAAAEYLPRTLSAPDPAANDFALRAALAGRHDAPVRLELADENGVPATAEFQPGVYDRPEAPLTAERLDGGIGYVRIHNSLGDTRLVAAWDSALAALRDTRGLVLDLRDTPGGGNTTVARGILGRLIAEERPYQRHELAAEERRHGIRRIWVEHAAPRGPFTYTRPVVVLVGRWTASMGEGLAIGLDGMRRAQIVGTPMARLQGALYDVVLPRTRFTVRIPAERLYHVDGTPREAWSPGIRPDPPRHPGDDPALAAALEILRAR
ncbi:MAG TPA: S41 family peptidase [Longimicrobium sp.]|jgi:carboxyl-terminal processing protease|uniref:S41 family peptidase n=1 Tax=Longimicrobium sp. TaxID=2029185 RepID=UPI002ED7F5A6